MRNPLSFNIKLFSFICWSLIFYNLWVTIKSKSLHGDKPYSHSWILTYEVWNFIFVTLLLQTDLVTYFVTKMALFFLKRNKNGIIKYYLSSLSLSLTEEVPQYFGRIRCLLWINSEKRLILRREEQKWMILIIRKIWKFVLGQGIMPGLLPDCREAMSYTLSWTKPMRPFSLHPKLLRSSATGNFLPLLSLECLISNKENFSWAVYLFFWQNIAGIVMEPSPLIRELF